MKKNMKIVYTAALLLVIMLSLCACGDNWEAPYASLDQQGSAVSVRFDANGGLFAGTSDVYIVDVFNLSEAVSTNGCAGFYLLSPDDPIRGSGSFSVSKNGYFLAGWYTERSLRVDENGNALDEYGILCSVSGREQGYTYSGLWDFDADLLTVDTNGTYTSEQPVATLYAGWVPYINYDFYVVDETGTQQFIETVQTINLEIPKWSEKTGKLDLNSFPALDGHTFNAAYLDAALSVALDADITGADNYVDYGSGTLNVESVAIYTTWLDGNWYKIFTAEQFLSNARLDGSYMICADLDFSDTVWSPTLVKGKFSGTILGNGHTISNLTVTQADNSQIYGGLFGTLEAGASIQDLTFENISFTIEAGSRMQGASFGLLAGSISSEAVLKNVTVTGTLYISKNCYPSDYTIGLLCGSGSTDGVNYTIDCLVAEDNAENITITVYDDDTVTVTFN